MANIVDVNREGTDGLHNEIIGSFFCVCENKIIDLRR